MSRQKRWIFESRASLEEFGRRLRMILRSQGFVLDEAKVFDFSARYDGTTVWVALDYHHRGIEATVKVKAGLLGDPGPMQDRIFELLRRTQLELAGGTSEEEGGDDPDQRPAQAGAGDVLRAEADQDEGDGQRQHGQREDR